MGIPKEPKPVKYFVALLSGDAELLSFVKDDLTVLLGCIDSSSPILPWTMTRYYEEEMGSGLLRGFVSFGPLCSPESLAEIKIKTHGLEEKHQRVEGEKKRRRVNIDPGYLDAGKVVLASTKDAPHRIYLHSGIYGEATLLYHGGSFHPFSYTYPDYLWPEALGFFTDLRSLYLHQIRREGIPATEAKDGESKNGPF